MKALFDQLSFRTSRIVTQRYSTSFTLGILGLKSELHDPIYAIYGFVRFADEIVDTFHEYPKERLLQDFKRQTYQAIEDGISLNPILNSFQSVVRQYNIDHDLIETFLRSMEMDLDPTREYDKEMYDTYILGSAEVVGLMCLKVFVDGNEERYQHLKSSAMKLGSAFQKINFLRDLSADFHQLGRSYFPDVDLGNFDEEAKRRIEADIEADFAAGFEGIKQLPKGSRFGVYIAYVYYYALFGKIKRTSASVVFKERIRIPNRRKYRLFVSSYLRHSFNLL
ncbi:phytoene/squalene synthase family protein [Phaeocystidibacter luteus]|uniref:Phytoene/squalene synthase family protein n=1 Tax=Phaeocystidibacter luteus TaxID=911197 RepID=A0A6N6RLL3_9FLAO|nr:phytoene/squalene synthase family protein [Phaeocystidibacter luteus]KAB2814464.1 phytoene/squalene synthase family protein [Phaeocystidibacter luteus]